MSRAGKTFSKYYSDKRYGGPRKALKVAEDRLERLKDLLDNSRRVNGKLTQTTIKKAEKLLNES